MRRVLQAFRNFFNKADLLLLALCLVTNIFGIIMVASASNWMNSNRNVIVQIVATVLGVIAYFVFTMIDIDIIAERREILFLFNALFIAMLFTPLAVDVSGNRSWIRIPGIPFNIQPPEICKITFIILIAKTMSVYQRKISSPMTVFRLGFHLIFIFGLIYVASSDVGSALMYVLIFLIMLWAGGVHWSWFAIGGTLAVIGAPIVMRSGLVQDYQRQRVMMIFDPAIDPDGSGVRWHTKNSLLTLSNGGVTGQGLFQGSRTQVGALSQQHTDFIFSVIGEELGIIGCILVLAMLTAIIVRCVYVGVKSGNYMNRQVCIGIAAMLIWQIIINVGMCIGLTPVIGLTLPFISYGGSSVITMYAALGIVSGIYMRPAPDSSAHYIRPPYYKP